MLEETSAAAGRDWLRGESSSSPNCCGAKDGPFGRTRALPLALTSPSQHLPPSLRAKLVRESPKGCAPSLPALGLHPRWECGRHGWVRQPPPKKCSPPHCLLAFVAGHPPESACRGLGSACWDSEGGDGRDGCRTETGDPLGSRGFGRTPFYFLAAVSGWQGRPGHRAVKQKPPRACRGVCVCVPNPPPDLPFSGFFSFFLWSVQFLFIYFFTQGSFSVFPLQNVS